MYGEIARQFGSTIAFISILGFITFLFGIYMTISIWYNTRCTKINTDEMLRIQMIDFKKKYPEINILDEEWIDKEKEFGFHDTEDINIEAKKKMVAYGNLFKLG